MTRKEYANRNISMTFDFIRHCVEKPERLSSIPEGAEIGFLGNDSTVVDTDKKEPRRMARYRVRHVFEPMQS